MMTVSHQRWFVKTLLCGGGIITTARAHSDVQPQDDNSTIKLQYVQPLNPRQGVPLLSSSQYTLRLQDPFPDGWEPFFINCNDSSVEGIKSTTASGRRVCSVPSRECGRPAAARHDGATCAVRALTALTLCTQMFTDFIDACRAQKVLSVIVDTPRIVALQSSP